MSQEGLPRVDTAAAAPHEDQPLRLDLIEGKNSEASFSELLDEAFGLEPQKHFLSDFPVWGVGADPRRSIRFGAWDGDRLVACIGARIAWLQMPEGERHRVCLIGAVATALSHRGRGIASRLVSLACRWAEDRQAQLVVLWGSEHKMYQRLGFELCGRQVRVPIREIVQEAAMGGELGRGWVPAIWDRLRCRKTGLLLEDGDLVWMREHRGTQWYWSGSRENPSAYAAVGRGIDLPGMVHEWGGSDTRTMRALFAQIARESPDAEVLGSPWLMSEAGLVQRSLPIENLCLARVIDPSAKKLLESDALWFWGLDGV